jgi:signal transduction histidine kinase
MPDATGIYVATMSAGFRLSQGAAILGGAANLASTLGLAAIDRALNGDRFAVSVDTVSMFSIFVVAFALLAFILAFTTRQLAHSGARAAVRADRAEQGLGVMLGDHHDLRSLVAAVTLLADALRQRAEHPAADRAHAEALLADARTLTADLRRIGSILLGVNSRALAGVTALGEAETVVLAPAMAGAVTGVQAQFSSACLVSNVDPRVAVSVVGGEATLQRVLLNLLNNACQGRDHRHAASVTLRATGDLARGVVTIVVEDDGPGFSQEQLVDPYRASLDKPGGIGVGLAVVRGLVEASGGRLQLGNRQSGGALVTVTLPASATPS